MQHAWEERVGRREVSDLLGGVGDALRIVLPAYAAVAPAAYATPSHATARRLLMVTRL
jgi:hypothetical protein